MRQSVACGVRFLAFEKPNLSYMFSLIPSRQIVFSAELAATLGLEEAILLQCLSDESEVMDAEPSGKYRWFYLNATQLKQKLPFWQETDIQRIVENLRQQGVILISSAPINESKELRYAFNENTTTTEGTATQQAVPLATMSNTAEVGYGPRATPITASWRPDETSLRILAQNGVPAHFAHEQTAEFVHYWSERGEARHSWGSRFVTHALRKWRDFESQQNVRKPAQIDSNNWDLYQENTRENEPKIMAKEWRPSTDAMEILQIQAGIHRNFAEDAIPEFILYWTEKGDRCNTWNARFINHVKRQWAEFQHTIKNEKKPSVMTADWQPSNDVYDVLKFARIDIEFAQNLVPEFVMYWRDRNEMRPSWNTLFLQFAKQQWQRRNSTTQSDNSLRERSIVEDLSDRSWAN